MLNIENIGIIGVGGVGGYFGGKLCSLLDGGGARHVSFVARGEHLRVIREAGLWLSSESDGDQVCRPTLATDDFACLPRLDLALICVKEFDLPAALIRLAPLVNDSTILLPLLNGVDIYSRVRSVIRNGIVLPACVYVGTHIERPGKVHQRGGACRILFGPDPQQRDLQFPELLSLFNSAGIKCEWKLDIQAQIWRKFIFICGFGLVSAAFARTLGEIVEDPDLSAKVESIMREASAVARASGVDLPDEVVAASMSKAKEFPSATKTSFQRDFERLDRPDERDLFGGAMIRMADTWSIAVPTITTVAEMLAARKPIRTSANVPDHRPVLTPGADRSRSGVPRS